MEANIFTPPRINGVSRRNTIGTAGSPFNYRRPRALQSTPLGNVSNVRNLNDSSFTAGPAVVNARPAPVLEISDCSTIPPVGDMMEHKFAAERDRRPFIFGRDNVENYGERKDLFGNKDMNMSLNSSRFDPSRNHLKRGTPPSTDFLESQVDDQETQPALLFSNVSKRVITPITENEEDKPASGTRKGPPLRSLHTFEPVIKRARTITSHDIQKDPNSKTPEQDYWVTVFGFDRTQLPDVMDLFGRHGNIVKSETPEEGNWIYLRYGSVTHAHQAIARNGQLLDKTMIGVVPSTKPNGTQSFQTTPKIPGHNEKLSETFGVPTTSSLSDSTRIEKGTYTGMRACAAPGFKFTEPKPNESIMSKIINFPSMKTGMRFGSKTSSDSEAARSLQTPVYSAKKDTIISVPDSLGFNITGGIDEPYIPGYNDFFITRIRPDGAAAKDGRLHVGDRVVAVNNQTLSGMTHDSAVNIFKNATGTVKLLIEQDAELNFLSQPSTILPTPVAAATGLMKSESSGRESPDSFSEGNKENGMATSVIIKEDGIQAIDPKNSPRAEVEIESKDEIEHDRDSLVVHGPPEIPVHFVRDNESGKVPRSSKQDNDDDRGSTFSGFPDDVPRTPKRPISILDPASQSVLTEAVFISIGVVALAAGVFLAYRLIKRT